MNAQLQDQPFSYEEPPRGLRVPPNSREAEQAVIGGLLLSTEALDTIAGVVSADDFYSRDHRILFEAIVDLNEQGAPADAVTLSDWLGRHQHARGIEPSYVIHLANITPSAANIVAYAQIVRDKATLRRLADVSTKITQDALAPYAADAEEIVQQAEQAIFKIAEGNATGRKEIHSSTDVSRAAFQVLVHRYENRGQLTGVATGFADLDKLTAGLQPSDLVIVAARPSMGKTAFALNVAESAAVTSKRAVVVFSMEMSASQLGLRLISSMGRIDAQHLRTGDLAEEDWPRVTEAVNKLTSAKIFIDDTPSLSPGELRSRARRLHREQGGLALIVIDYLQLMQVPGNSENRATEISEISRSLKALAKELNVPVVALSQLNRSLEQRADKRPVMSDLRESGAIEQDADLIMFIYRDEYYNRDSEDKGFAEVIVGKQRNGPTDTVKLAFLGRYTRFENAHRGAEDTFTAGF
ncbi:replicative DNA helicase [Rhodanobacter sp. FW510-R12]|uniref:replicative DNA helicase n=1 Tax=Rhodanobacter thiooxydans TaxID=416169 RepID=UPI000911FDE7|nr:replicative DNA helicase [Rhodanobacter thiooxydans]UJJ56794.1 replicative DNA helicase [Rhodanobacter thiooxydans]